MSLGIAAPLQKDVDRELFGARWIVDDSPYDAGDAFVVTSRVEVESFGVVDLAQLDRTNRLHILRTNTRRAVWQGRRTKESAS